MTGLSWLATPASPADVLTPERLSGDHRLVAQTTAEFVANEVSRALPDLERRNWPVARRLITQAAALGLVGADVPESDGGIGLDKAAGLVVAEGLGGESSFAMAFGAQTGLAILPLLAFGSAEQRRRYLPRLLSGELIGAYALSEAGSGSDALAARTRAVQQPDGSWRLTGEKLWITNGAFADLFVVFAKADGEQFTAFLVERAFGGVTHGDEERKLGLHGSSTTPIVLADVPVPAANVLGEVGRGHIVAFNVLNYGRFKLAATTSGATKVAIAEATAYAVSRHQFGRPIATFGAVRHKLAEMALREYAVESMLYRTAGLLDATLGRTGHVSAALVGALEEFAIEASLLKIAGSECLDYAVDELVQIHGGNGFVRDYPAERRFRDARPNRIFEGTNEINRVLVPGLMARRLRQGRIVLPRGAEGDGVPPGDTTAHAGPIRAVLLDVLRAVTDAPGEVLVAEQDIAMRVTDMTLDLFAVESAELRAASAQEAGAPHAATHRDAADVLGADALARVVQTAETVVAAVLPPERLDRAVAQVRSRRGGAGPVNTLVARRRIADGVVERRGYPW